MRHHAAMESLRGKLLIATPALGDPNFARTVVVIGEHTADGALGVVLNRPSQTPVADAVPDLVDLVEPGDVVHVGGPVQPSAVLVLAQFDAAEPDRRQMVLDGVGFLAVDEEDVPDVDEPPARARIFAGYAGWGAGQLELELEREDWIVEPCRADDVFAEEPEHLWSRVLDRKGGRYRLVARMPVDPSLN